MSAFLDIMTFGVTAVVLIFLFVIAVSQVTDAYAENKVVFE